MKKSLLDSNELTTKTIFQNKIRIAERIDNATNSKLITYVLSDNPSAFYSNEQIYIDKILMFLRKYQDFMYKVLINCKTTESKICLSSLVSNFFYVNTLSSNSIEEEYLIILYRTLKHEIEQLKRANAPSEFLGDSINSYMLSNIIRNEDVKTYFGKILNQIIENIENIENREEGQVLNFDPNKLNDYIKKKKEIKLARERASTKKAQNNRDNVMRTNSDSLTLSKAFTIKDPLKGDTSTGSGEVNDTPGRSQSDTDNFFKKYIPDLTKKELIKILESEKNNAMKDYIMKQLNEYKNNDSLYANTEFLDNVYKSKESTEVLALYQSNFSIVIELIDQLFFQLINNISIIPNSIRYLCKIISILLKKQFPTITAVELNAFVAEFFIEKLMRPIFTIPDYNGLLTTRIVSSVTKDNIKLIQDIIKQIVNGNFYKAKENPNFTIFNWFFLDTMPYVLKFFEQLTDITFPPFIERLINSDEKMMTPEQLSVENYIYNFFKEHPNEQIRLLNIAYTADDVINIMDIIKRNESVFIPKDIDKNVYLDFDFYKVAISKLKTNDHLQNIMTAKASDTNNNSKTFTLIKEYSYNCELSLIMKLSGKHFSIKEVETPKDDKERELNVLIKFKNSMSEVLCNFHDIPDDNFFGLEIKNTDDFIRALVSMSTINYYNLDNNVQTEWYILSLQSLYTKIPEEYRAEDYSKFYQELTSQIQTSLSQMDYDRISQVVDRYRYSFKELKQTEDSFQTLELVEFKKKVQEFTDNSPVEIYMKFVSQDRAKKLSIIAKDASLNLKFKYLDNFLFEKKSDSGKLCANIFLFCRYFPSFTKQTSHEEELFAYEKKLDVPKALRDYFAIVRQCIKNYKGLDFANLGKPSIDKEQDKDKDKDKDKKNEKEKKKEKKEKEKDKEKNKENDKLIEEGINKMLKEVKEFIMTKIYDKIYPPEADSDDLKIYQMCVMLSWVEPKHLCKVQKLNLENFLPNTVGYIQKLDSVKSPYGKMKLFEKVIEIILNTLTFCVGKKVEGGVDDQLPLLIYVIIKAQPPRLSSNLTFIELYHDEMSYGPEAQKFAMLSAIKERLLDVKAKDLNGVEDNEFNE